MIEHTPDTRLFKEQMCDSLQRETRNSSAIKIAKHDNVYTVGEAIEMVYFIESGKVKLAMVSSEGKECMLAVHGEGDIFGELCLSGLKGRQETASALEDTVLKPVLCGRFLERLAKDSLLEGFIKYLTGCVADQQEVIANLVTVDSEQGLRQTLLQMASNLGQQDPRI